MAAESDHVARFDHVSSEGQLVFTVDGRNAVVTVDDELERAILEAKQILSERMEDEAPAQRTQPLPISQIQSLIRAGATTEQVAAKYSLSEAIVRRFSTSVEAEKQYAINQFLHVGAPRESHMHTISQLIENTLAAAQVAPASVSWAATRRGLEPWQISATFESNGRPVVARWSWNMRDNAVVCENNAASVLLGEFIPSENTAIKAAEAAPDDDSFPMSLNLPGNSADSARIEMTLSSWRHDQAAAAVAERDALRMEASRRDPADRPSGEQVAMAPAGDGGQVNDGGVPAAVAGDAAATGVPDAGIPVAGDGHGAGHPDDDAVDVVADAANADDMDQAGTTAEDHAADGREAGGHDAAAHDDMHDGMMDFPPTSDRLVAVPSPDADVPAATAGRTGDAVVSAAPKAEVEDAREAARKRTPNVSISAIAGGGRSRRQNDRQPLRPATTPTPADGETTSVIDQDDLRTPTNGFPAVNESAQAAAKKAKKNNAFRSWDEIIFG
ncbi:septation protein SepH [Bifidobacterium choloepi]|uniref:DUF3071 domain-containing protein n=1 Tax=Bifidobacterium choloepi TaxID=2614131 RepID=A0A6I5N0N9_9BIFI|nr:septation protein SepH [Bifidobacterium choloepi]NEG70147.1 DUF3071 domain-containing protein [Bifidobacterium choloepi]